MTTKKHPKKQQPNAYATATNDNNQLYSLAKYCVSNPSFSMVHFISEEELQQPNVLLKTS